MTLYMTIKQSTLFQMSQSIAPTGVFILRNFSLPPCQILPYEFWKSNNLPGWANFSLVYTLLSLQYIKWYIWLTWLFHSVNHIILGKWSNNVIACCRWTIFENWYFPMPEERPPPLKNTRGGPRPPFIFSRGGL